MSEIKKEFLKKRLEAYYEAELAVLTSQSYTIGTRTLTRANLSEIRRAIKEMETQLEYIENGGKRKMTRVIPRDL